MVKYSTMVEQGGQCAAFQNDGNCFVAKDRGWIYNRGKPGTSCSFEGDLNRCNEYDKNLGSQFWTLYQLLIFERYGVSPYDGIPEAELCPKEIPLTHIVPLAGTVVEMDGRFIQIQPEGSLKDITDSL